MLTLRRKIFQGLGYCFAVSGLRTRRKGDVPNGTNVGKRCLRQHLQEARGKEGDNRSSDSLPNAYVVLQSFESTWPVTYYNEVS